MTTSDAEHMIPTPAPLGRSGHHPSVLAVLRHFETGHLAHPMLADVSSLFRSAAHELVHRLPSSPELVISLRRLLDAKDSAVRAAVDELRNTGGDLGRNRNDLT